MMKILIKNKYSVRLLLIGPVDKADLPVFSSYMDDPAIKNAITYFPWKDISLLPSYITCSNLCLSPIFKNPQHESGVANKIFQYMLFARPILVSNCLPQQKIVEEGNCGFVFESDNPVDLADRVNLLLKSPELCQKFGENGRKLVLKEYNLQNFGKNLVKLYDSV